MRAVLAALLVTGCASAPALEAERPALEAERPALEDVLEVEPAAPVSRYLPAPSFRFQALGDSGTHAIEDYAGRFLLVDFWASWCAPCLEEVPQIASVLEDHPDRLAVLSVSLDGFEDDVDAFRRRVHPMPWDHAFVPGGFEDDGVAAFSVDRLPYPFLIGPDGTLRADGAALRGDLLRPTIERALEAEP